MAQTSKAIREAYNAKTYRTFSFRVRKNSDLCEKLENVIATKHESLNHIINQKLAEHYDVPMPEARQEKAPD